MNLQQTIDELEQQAARYTEAANTLRGLLNQEVALPETSAATSTPSQSSEPAKDGRKGRKTGKKRVVSAETKAKLAASMKARHQKRREEREGSAAQNDQSSL